jgi:hypothetical protein
VAGVDHAHAAFAKAAVDAKAADGSRMLVQREAPATIVLALPVAGSATPFVKAATMSEVAGLTVRGPVHVNQRLIHRVVRSRDQDGRVLRVAVYFGGETPFPDFPGALDKVPPEERAKMATLVAQLFADRTFASIAYT